MLAAILPNKQSFLLNIEISALLHLNFSEQMKSQRHSVGLVFMRDSVPDPDKDLTSYIHKEYASLVSALDNAAYF